MCVIQVSVAFNFFLHYFERLVIILGLAYEIKRYKMHYEGGFYIHVCVYVNLDKILALIILDNGTCVLVDVVVLSIRGDFDRNLHCIIIDCFIPTDNKLYLRRKSKWRLRIEVGGKAHKWKVHCQRERWESFWHKQRTNSPSSPLCSLTVFGGLDDVHS